jgi:hypothetical protein
LKLRDIEVDVKLILGMSREELCQLSKAVVVAKGAVQMQENKDILNRFSQCLTSQSIVNLEE